MANAKRGDGRTVTSKVLAMLSAFEEVGGALTLSELAQHADIPLPTAHRLAAELVEWGALERTPHGRYVVGLRLWEVSQNAGRQLRDAARPFLQDLFSLTQETAHIAVRDGRDALYIDRVYGSTRVPRASRVGGRLPLHATAVGKVLLAYEEDWVREAYLSARLEGPTRRTHVQPEQLSAELDRVRAQGYAVTLEEVREGSCSIAVPVHTSPLPSALGLVMPSTKATQMERHLPALRGVAGRIEAAVRIPQSAPGVRGPRRPLTK
ncbi:IclR family transcriptional regulator [Gordonia rhizosphera]|uniref:Putative IclR family transcriptional regulator n=1 Tax=Gordonia rhizosphera NBRC 16068 TaxID=1108045 RepID=K6V5M6_9ACTN|nr:IclR family transcriptional regulator [Gordonia rhizosphera]GAB91558.1 putative IclR family transcriptional regulator [Gordonia rhizosphera NBRC 16068]